LTLDQEAEKGAHLNEFDVRKPLVLASILQWSEELRDPTACI
jgi:hypothetical protein